MIYSFANFCLDTARRELRSGLDVVGMEPQVYDLMLFLLVNRHRVVGKDDLLAGVWEGRIVSESTISSRIAAVRQALGDAGSRQQVVRTIPRKGYRFVASVVEAGGPERVLPAASRQVDRPSIAVLPFVNLSGDKSQDYFVDGVIEDITTALSQFRWISVVARTTSFVYRDRTADVRLIGRELGVRYLLEGSVRKSGRRLRIVAQLVDADSGTHLWADRFDGDLNKIFDLQDQLTGKVVGAIAPRLERAEIERATRKPTGNLDAYDLYLRGIARAYEWTRRGMDAALQLFSEAIGIDPNFAPAYGMGAYCYVQRKSYAWSTDRARDAKECASLTEEGAEIGRDDAVTLARVAHGESYVVGDVDRGAVLADRALELNPNLTNAWYVKGWINVFLGEHERAIDCARQALRFSSPFDPTAFKLHTLVGYAHFFSRRYDDASTATVTALRLRPNYLTAIRGAAASLALAGRLDDARRLMTQMREADSGLRLSNLDGFMPLRRSDDFGRWSEGLRLAGLPD